MDDYYWNSTDSPSVINDATTSNGMFDLDDDNNDISNYEIDTLLGRDESDYILDGDMFKFFNNCPDLSKHTLDLLHVNVRSMCANFNSVTNLLSTTKCKPSILALSETWLDESSQDLFHLEGYNFFNKNRLNMKKGGGVGMFITDDFEVKVLNDMSVTNDIIECIFVEATCKLKHNASNQVLIGCVYRPPGGDISEFVNALSTILTSNKKVYKISILTGDFNIDLIKYSTHLPTQDFMDTLASHSFIPTITKPTRITNFTSTLLDNFFVNCSTFKCRSSILYNDISDHFPILLKIGVPIQNNSSSSVNKRLFTKGNIDNFRNNISLIDWSLVFGADYGDDNPDRIYTKFLDYYNKLFLNNFPIEHKKLPKYRVPRKEWITPGLVNSCYKKSKLYKKYKQNPTVINEMKYKEYRNKLKVLLLNAEKSFYADKIKSCYGDHKQLWNVLNVIINKKKKNPIDFKFLNNGQMITDPKVIVDSFNNFFVSIGPDLASKISTATTDFKCYLKGSYVNSFYLTPVDCTEIINIAHILPNKKSYGFDEIPVTIMKQTIDLLAKPLSDIINLSFSKGIVPKLLKMAKVCPVYKNGSRSEIGNYRPISVLPSFSKIFEKLVFERLNNYLTEMNIIISNQYGFRAHHSTTMALLDLYDRISQNIDDKKFIIGLFIDLQKAFDTINHDILLVKLFHYGIRGIALDWFNSYLSGRQQCVSINNVTSNYESICCGVPQGSILGPLLFLIYVNDIVNCSDLSYFILFADDTNILFSGDNLDKLIVTINSELEKLSIWFKANKLSLNLKKTNFITFGGKEYRNSNHNVCDIQIDTVKIEQVFSVKFLGVVIDERLSWRDHISSLSKIISKNIGIINKVKYILSTDVLMTLYNALVLSHLSYNCLVWGWASTSALDHISKLQKRIARIITKSSFLAHSDPLFYKLNMLKISDICKLQTAMILYRLFNEPNALADAFYSRFNFLRVNKQYSTRSNCANLNTPYCRTVIRSNSFACKGPFVWNSLPDSLFNCSSHFSFKKQYKLYLVNSYLSSS